MRIIATADKYLPAIYDFDFSGAARAPYSGPPPTLPIRKVTERLYRGPCAEEAIVAPVFAKYRAQQANWMALPDSIPGLSGGYVRFVKDYMEEFFRSIKDDKSAMRAIMGSCNQRPSA
jgi:hypothetical protein